MAPSRGVASRTPGIARAASAAAANVARAERATRSRPPTRATSSRRVPSAMIFPSSMMPTRVAEPLGLLHVVRRIEDAHALVAELLDAGQDGVPALRVDTDGRLVEDQQAGPVEQAHADVEAALHPAGELLGPFLRPVREVDDREHLVDPTGELAAAQPVQPPEEREVLAGAEVRVDREVLGHVADRALERRSRGVQGLPGEQHLAGVAAEDPADHRDRRRLPGAVRTEQAVGLARRDLEADAVDRLALAEALSQPRAAEDGGGRRDWRSGERGDGVSGRRAPGCGERTRWMRGRGRHRVLVPPP